MKVVTANKINRLWRNGVLAKMIAKTKVHNTAEEIEANTSAENVAGATVAKELYNNLIQHPEGIKDSTGKITGYKTQEGGADAVFPFSNPYIKEMRASMSVSGGNYVNGSFIIVPNGAKKIILSSLYNASISKQVNCAVTSSANRIDVADPSIDCSFSYSAVAHGGTSPSIIGAISSFE